MTGFDYTVIAIVLLSALLGWWRGFVYEVLSLLGWIAAGVVARLFAANAAPYMPAALGAESARIAAAFVVLFVATLIVGGIVAWLLSKLVKWVGLGWLDGMLGTLFGTLRGVLVVLVLVVLAGMTRLPQEPFWRNAWSSKPLESMALTIQAWLPDSVAQRVHY
jgi:membrane protein required for colicin V production